MRRALPSTAALIAFALLLCAQTASAQAGLRVSPIGLELANGARTTSFRVHNEGDRARAFEICVFRWTQANGADVLEPSGDIIVSPSVFEARPGRTQIVRAALAPDVGGGETERSYRFVLRELILEDAPVTQGLRIRLDMSMPVFVRARDVYPRLRAHWEAQTLTITNEGGGHTRLAGLRVGGAEIDAPRYLLPGASFSRTAAPLGPVRASVVMGGALAEITLADAAPPTADRH